MKVLFVCTGNTCRSPMLMYMLRDYAAKTGCECETDSAGFAAEDGAALNASAERALKSRGIDCGGFAAKKFRAEVADGADVIFTMNEAGRGRIAAECARKTVVSLSEMAGREIGDPYGGAQSDYDALADLIESILDKILAHAEKFADARQDGAN